MRLTDQLLEGVHPTHERVADVVPHIETQSASIEGIRSLLFGGWFEQFAGCLSVSVGDLRSLARYLSGGGRTQRTAAYLTSQDMDTTSWNMRTLLRAVTNDRADLQQHDETVAQLSADLASPEFMDAVMQEGPGGQHFKEMLQVLVDVNTSRALMLDDLYGHLGDGDAGSIHGDSTETLYHASTNARVVFQHGFQEPGSSSMGLSAAYGQHPQHGNNDREISFTSDLAIAHEIVRSLQEVIEIARGDLDYDTVFGWANESGALITASNDHTPLGVFSVYRDYMRATDRYNPVYLDGTESLLEELADARPDEAAVLECKVKIDDDVDYLRSLREFQIPIASVISVDRILLAP